MLGADALTGRGEEAGRLALERQSEIGHHALGIHPGRGDEAREVLQARRVEDGFEPIVAGGRARLHDPRDRGRVDIDQRRGTSQSHAFPGRDAGQFQMQQAVIGRRPRDHWIRRQRRNRKRQAEEATAGGGQDDQNRDEPDVDQALRSRMTG